MLTEFVTFLGLLLVDHLLPILKKITSEIDLKHGGCIHYGAPQGSLTFGCTTESMRIPSLLNH